MHCVHAMWPSNSITTITSLQLILIYIILLKLEVKNWKFKSVTTKLLQNVIWYNRVYSYNDSKAVLRHSQLSFHASFCVIFARILPQWFRCFFRNEFHYCFNFKFALNTRMHARFKSADQNATKSINFFKTVQWKNTQLLKRYRTVFKKLMPVNITDEYYYYYTRLTASFPGQPW